MKKQPFDGSRVRQYLSSEVKALLEVYDQFATLVPHPTQAGAAHRGEDGRFVETLIRSYLRRLLPSNLEILTGFILRPAVKTGTAGEERRGQTDEHSGQLDMIVFDSAHYPTFQRLGDTAIVPPEGVIAVLSVKKHLRDQDIINEGRELWRAAQLCSCLGTDDQPLRGPFLGLISVKSYIEKQETETATWMFDQVKKVYDGATPTFDDLLGVVGSFEQGTVFKSRPEGSPPTKARYVWIDHSDGEHHFGLQLVLTGILSAYYDQSRGRHRRPGFSGFESGRNHDKGLGKIAISGLR